ncbi:hypothetical protein BLA29_011590 [Euroglyphus maynei]|uniref:Uncharacterized protein n=1 Tax=Euroglyphus maynei TaxID=6958 RepID=A0A1Y3BC21_EURMA|nr:hypothetical protein BLA29_011590 [Euroglyphus maynei]
MDGHSNVLLDLNFVNMKNVFYRRQQVKIVCRHVFGSKNFNVVQLIMNQKLVNVGYRI